MKMSLGLACALRPHKILSLILFTVQCDKLVYCLTCMYIGNIARGKQVTMSQEYCVGCDKDKNPSGHPFGGYLAVDGYSRNNDS
jgi:hypothetical protein